MSTRDICIIDAGPLITFAMGDGLKELTAAGNNYQFKILDVVAVEAGRRGKPGGDEIADWIDKMQGIGKLDVIETEVGKALREGRAQNPKFRIKNAGENAIAEWLTNGGADAANSAVVVFEDDDTRKLLKGMSQDANITAVTTRAFILDGEAAGYVKDPKATWGKIAELAPTRTDVIERFQASQKKAATP